MGTLEKLCVATSLLSLLQTVARLATEDVKADCKERKKKNVFVMSPFSLFSFLLLRTVVGLVVDRAERPLGND